MAYARNLMGAGIPAAAAAADVIAAVATAVSAAGTNQATATTLKADANLVSTAAASSGVVLSDGQIGDSVFVFNDATGNNVNVYPPSSHKINNLATNSPVVLGQNTSIWLLKVTATRWIGMLSA